MFKKRVVKKDNARASETRHDAVAEARGASDEAGAAEAPAPAVAEDVEPQAAGSVPDGGAGATKRKAGLGGGNIGGFKKRRPFGGATTAAAAAAATPAAPSTNGPQPAEGNSNSNISSSIALSSGAEKTPTAVTGPLKAIPANIKTTTVVDFQPDVCKDFLQTGYCGYGDTCKFLHVRDESRQKKPVVKEWKDVAAAKGGPRIDKSAGTGGSGTAAAPLPFRCVLCKSDYKAPVQTNCGHLFCQKCFLDRVKKKNKSSCFVCGADTLGVCRPVSTKELAALIDTDES